MNAPKIVYRLEKFNFDVSLDVCRTASTDHVTDYIAALRIRKNHLLSDREVDRGANDRSIVEHNDGLALFANWLGQASCFTRQASNRDSYLKADWIGTC